MTQKNKQYRLKNFFKWFNFLCLLLLFMIVGRLSLKNAYKFGRLIGALLFQITNKRRKIVEENIQILKDWGERRNLKNPLLNQDISAIAKEIYKCNAGNFFYSWSMTAKSTDTLSKHLKIKNMEVLNKAFEKNKGVIILFSHTGPWELIALLSKLDPSISEVFNFAAVYRVINNPYLNRWYLKKRSRFGIKMFSRDDGFLKIMRHVKNKSILFIASDIRMSTGPKADFFDLKTTASKIPYTFHKGTKAPMISITLVKSGDLKWDFQFNEILPLEQDEYTEQNILKASNEDLERLIFNDPYNYFFFQNRLK